MLRALDAATIGRWAAVSVEALDGLCARIDRINVYPVPDSDTGSNLLHTMRSAADTLAGTAPAGAGDALARLATGAVSGARGNSGVIMAQVLRGCAEELRDEVTADGARWSAALARAELRATRAVAQPVDGTVLTVLGAAARGVAGETDLPAVTGTSATAAAEALTRTTEQLPVLAEAGVVDAGGWGLLVVLDALHAVVTGGELPTRRVDVPNRTPPVADVARAGYGYEVMYLLDGVDDDELLVLREALVGIGDCVTVAGDGTGRHAVHVHCDDIGAAIEAGVEAGRPHQIAVTPLRSGPVEFTAQRAGLALVRTTELAELLRAEGVYTYVACGDEYDPAQAFEAVRRTGAEHVTVLGADEELSALASGAAGRAEADGQDVVVVPCASPVQVLAALAVHDPSRRAADDVVAMAEAAAATRYGELRVADEEALTWVGRCAPGDLLGLVDGEVVLLDSGPVRGDALAAALCGICERMLATGGELVTVLLGEGADAELTERLRAYLHDEHPEVDLVVYPGADPEATLLVGVE